MFKSKTFLILSMLSSTSVFAVKKQLIIKPSTRSTLGRELLDVTMDEDRICIRTVKAVLEQGAFTEKKDRFSGHTPLLVAAGAGDIDVIRLLLRYKANINAKSNSGWTALSYACQDGKPELVEFLIDNGARLNKADIYKNTPLHQAVARFHDGLPIANYKDKVACAKLLIKNGARLNALNSAGNTALDIVCDELWIPENQHVIGKLNQLKSLLLEHGAKRACEIKPRPKKKSLIQAVANPEDDRQEEA